MTALRDVAWFRSRSPGGVLINLAVVYGHPANPQLSSSLLLCTAVIHLRSLRWLHTNSLLLKLRLSVVTAWYFLNTL